MASRRGLSLFCPPKGLQGAFASHLGTDCEGTEVRTGTWAGREHCGHGEILVRLIGGF